MVDTSDRLVCWNPSKCVDFTSIHENSVSKTNSSLKWKNLSLVPSLQTTSASALVSHNIMATVVEHFHVLGTMLVPSVALVFVGLPALGYSGKYKVQTHFVKVL